LQPGITSENRLLALPLAIVYAMAFLLDSSWFFQPARPISNFSQKLLQTSKERSKFFVIDNDFYSRYISNHLYATLRGCFSDE
jgi:dTDP-4-dehydrorhamnose reductase